MSATEDRERIMCMQGGNTTERYHELLAMVLSDMEESELEKVLLMAAGSNMDRDVEKNAT